MLGLALVTFTLGHQNPNLSGKCPEAMQSRQCLGQKMASCFLCSKKLRKQHICKHEQAKFFCWMTRPKLNKAEKVHEFPHESFVQEFHHIKKSKQEIQYIIPKTSEEMMNEVHAVEESGTCAEQCCEHVDPQGLALQLYHTTFGRDPCRVKLPAGDKTFKLIAADVCTCLRCHCPSFQAKYKKGTDCSTEGQGSFWAVPTDAPTKSPTRWQIPHWDHFGEMGKKFWKRHDKAGKRDCNGNWTVWSPCSALCGSSGNRTRHFTINQTATFGGRPCEFEAHSKQTQPCNRNITCSPAPTAAPTTPPTDPNDAKFMCEVRGIGSVKCSQIGCCVWANSHCRSAGPKGALCKDVKTNVPTPAPSPIAPHEIYSSDDGSKTMGTGEGIWAGEKCSDFLQRHCVYMRPKECRACSHQITKRLHKKHTCADEDIATYCVSARDVGKEPTPATPTAAPTLFPTNHPCDDGGHGCEKRLGGICYKDGWNEGGWKCGCESAFVCTRGCSAPHKQHRCDLRSEVTHMFPPEPSAKNPKRS